MADLTSAHGDSVSASEYTTDFGLIYVKPEGDGDGFGEGVADPSDAGDGAGGTSSEEVDRDFGFDPMFSLSASSDSGNFCGGSSWDVGLRGAGAAMRLSDAEGTICSSSSWL